MLFLKPNDQKIISWLAEFWLKTQDRVPKISLSTNRTFEIKLFVFFPVTIDSTMQTRTTPHMFTCPRCNGIGGHVHTKTTSKIVFDKGTNTHIPLLNLVSQSTHFLLQLPNFRFVSSNDVCIFCNFTLPKQKKTCHKQKIDKTYLEYGRHCW